jgi:uncharacterized protein YegL
MKTKKGIYHFVVDKSGSMMGLEEQVVTGFNMQLSKMKELAQTYKDQEYVASVTYFDGEVQEIIKFESIDKVKPLHFSNYVPDGMTALLDAVGGAIDKTIENYHSELKAKEVNVVFIILTDGDENSSQYYTHNLVSSKIKKLEETGDWTFTFIGADFDAREVSQKLNIRKENVVSLSKAFFSREMTYLSDSMDEYEQARLSGNKKSNFFSSILNRFKEDDTINNLKQ